MPDRFRPHRRLLTTLIGSNLYGSPDACVRELLQNAWDAIQWRRLHGDGASGTIRIRYSDSARWFEVSDDGYGMDKATITNSFLEVGQDKLAVLGNDSREGQISYFGIGILSVFLVAERFRVTTRRLGSSEKTICFEINGVDENVEYHDCEESSVGTTVRIYPKPDDRFSISDIPSIVRRYVRHVEGVLVDSVDDNRQETIPDAWDSNDFVNYRSVGNITGIRSGRFTFSPALRDQSGTLENNITICNAGFLTESNIHDLLPSPTLGMVAEFDLDPHAVTMGMSRERIQRDELWKRLGDDLQKWFISTILTELERGLFQPQGALDSPEIKRCILLWCNFLSPTPPFSDLYEALDARLYETVPFSLPERSQSSLQGVVDGRLARTRIYFRNVSRPNERIQTIDDEGLPIRVSEEIRDSVRIAALRAKGHEVIELDRTQVSFRRRGTVYSQWIEDYPIVLRCLQRRGIELVDVAKAPDSDMDLGDIERLPILRDALVIAGELRFAVIQDSKRRTVTDRSGVRYINLRNPDVRRLLRVIPAAVSNPLRQRLLDVYLKIEDFRLREARTSLLALLGEKELQKLASVDAAPQTRRYVERLVDNFLSEPV